nr:MAG TPA: hypothetical protein [Caudoviricetes sp.]
MFRGKSFHPYFQWCFTMIPVLQAFFTIKSYIICYRKSQ